MRKADAFRIAIAVAITVVASAPETRAETRGENGAPSRVAMPFACAYEPASGRLRMTPGPEQVYEIVNQRQTRRASVCHPVRGCRTWVLHRFHMLCGEHRVAWLNVVAATLAPMRGQRVTIEDGRLVLMRPIAVERTDRSNCFDRLSGSGVHVQRRLFADGRIEDCWHEPRPSPSAGLEWRIALPPGFAPGRLVSARFLTGSREVIAAAADMAPATVPVSAPVAVSAPAPTSAEEPAVVMPPDAVAIPAEAGGETGTSGGSASSVAVEGSPATPATAGVMPPPDPSPPAAQPSRLAAESVPHASEAQAAVPDDQSERSAVSGATTPADQAQSAGAGDAFAVEPYWAAPGIALGLAGLVWLVRRRRGQRTALPRDFALISLPAPGARGPDADAIAQLAATATENLARCRECLSRLPAALPIRVVIARELNACVERLGKLAAEQLETTEEVRRIRVRLQAITRDLQRLAAIAEGASSSMTAGALVPVDIAEPRDRFEAYAVLGVNPDVEPSVLKKLVDALRQSWHPDQARDEADRRRREDRIKQINVAWDIIQGKRLEA